MAKEPLPGDLPPSSTYLAGTANALYGQCFQGEDGLIYNPRQRKCKTTMFGMTTLISIINISVDWYNFVNYYSFTQSNIIHTQDTVTNALNTAFLVLCAISSVFVFMELIAFMLQFKDNRIYGGPVARSELLEEVTTSCIVMVENLGIQLVLLVGFFMGFCPFTAQIRSTSGRVALIVSGLSVLWRILLSFAFCPKYVKGSNGMLCCNFIRALRNLFTVLAGAVILFLLCVSFSVHIGVKIDKYNGRYYGTQYSDTQSGVYLYQRVAIPYYQNNTGNNQQNCDFYETRLKIATSYDLEWQTDTPYYNRIPCQDVSPFYESFITERHRSLLPSYSCHIVFAVANSDFAAARFINAVYELRDTNSQNCISENVELVLDSQFNPETHHFKAPLDTIWQPTIINSMHNSICPSTALCDSENLENTTIQGDLSFDCTSLQCAHVTDTASQSVGIISPLIVSNKEVMSYYPCMPQVHVYPMIDIPVCQPEVIESKTNKDATLSYTSCSNPYLVNTEYQEKWQEKSRDIINGIKLENQ